MAVVEDDPADDVEPLRSEELRAQGERDAAHPGDADDPGGELEHDVAGGGAGREAGVLDRSQIT
jgi:hypothetical protein